MSNTATCPPPTNVTLPESGTPEARDRLSDYAKALAHPIRVRIVELLSERNSCVCGELVDELPVAQSTVSQHLKHLKDAGLIRGEVEGPSTCYCLEPEAMAAMKALTERIDQPNRPGGIAFLCVANSARSQMAHGLARAMYPEDISIYSAGSEPSLVHSTAVEVMAEIGVDISIYTSDSVDTVEPSKVDLVLTLCAEEVCPAFLGDARRLHWPLEDPDREENSEPESKRLERFRRTRDEIQRRLRNFMQHGWEDNNEK